MSLRVPPRIRFSETVPRHAWLGCGPAVESGVVDRLAAAGLVLGESYFDSEPPQYLHRTDTDLWVQLVDDAGDIKVGADTKGLGLRDHFYIWIPEA